MEEEGGGDFPLTAVQGTQIIGITQTVAAVFAVALILNVGRRPIFVWGQFFIATSTFICGLSILYGWNMLAFISVNGLGIAYQMTKGGCAWMYVSEVTVDVASGLSMAAQYGNLTLISFTFESMMNSHLKVFGTIWYFSAISFIGTVFCYWFVKETRGLTDYEKKTLYTPKGYKDEDFKETELQTCPTPTTLPT